MLCAGGDGTLHHTVNAMAEAGLGLPVGYLPAGSTNDFAASAGLSEDMAESCARIASMRETRLDLGDFCGRRFCYVAAFGMFTDVSYSTPRQAKNLLGHMAYILEGVKRLNLFQAGTPASRQRASVWRTISGTGHSRTHARWEASASPMRTRFSWMTANLR